MRAPKEISGKEVCAWIKPSKGHYDNTEDSREFCKGKSRISWTRVTSGLPIASEGR
ncbi:hypothetical protein [Ruegeria profundi]|uniref:hypothetical protein n=1 Tax=Ruegeria profundi TaxID=1685378 RepID=UPI0012FDCD86|nr:hypothetical protein [Ruegeria profundi]